MSRSSVLHSKEREVLRADLWKEMLLPKGLLGYHFGHLNKTLVTLVGAQPSEMK